MGRVRFLVCALFLGFMVKAVSAQPQMDDWPDFEPSTSFEVYGLASGLRTIDATPTLVIKTPGQTLGFTPSGLASGGRVGFVWRNDRLGLVSDIGFHKYADRTGSTSIAPLMLGLRVYSDEHYRTSFFGEGLGGAYRWTLNSGTTNFVHVKGIVTAGGGMDVRLTRRIVWRVFELQLGIVSARNGPLLTGGPSTGIAYRF